MPIFEKFIDINIGSLISITTNDDHGDKRKLTLVKDSYNPRLLKQDQEAKRNKLEPRNKKKT